MMYCVSVNGTEKCMEGEWLLAALFLECAFYLLIFAFGHAGVNAFNKWRKKSK